MKRPLRFHPELFVIVILFLAAGALRMNDLLVYTPDSARYVIWGNSLASGDGYVDDTQTEELRFVVHAPLYPALIAPVELFFPLQVEPVKLYTLCWGAGALVLFWLWLRSLFGRWPAFAGALMLACNPLFLVYATEPLSEVPFIVFFLVILLGAGRLAADGRLPPAQWALLAVVSALIGVLREIGAVVWICLAGWLFFRDRRKSATVVLGGLLVMGGWYVRNNLLVGPPAGSPGGNAGLVFQHFLTGQDDAILKEFFMRLSMNFSSYGPDLLGMLFFPFYGAQHVALMEHPALFPALLKWSMVVLMGSVILRGIWRAVRSGSSERFMLTASALYVVAAALYPVHDVRFMVPLLPVLIFLVISGLRSVSSVPAVRARLVLGASFLVLALNAYPIGEVLRINMAYRESPADLHAGLSRGDDYPFYYTQPWSLLQEWIDGNVPTDAILATPTKELALVSGGRKVMELDPGLTQSLFERLLRSNGVTHLLAPVRWRDMKVYEFLMRESRRLSFTEVFAVSNLHVMKIGPGLRSGMPGEPPGPIAIDTVADAAAGADAAGCLRSARTALKSGNYAGALLMLGEASRSAPSYPEIRYQTVVARAMAGDSAGAAVEFAKLMTLPQIASFLFPARHHLYLMETELAVRRLPPGPERQMRTLDLARGYWDNGYTVKAREFLTAGMRNDTSFFVGLLWAFHFNFQTGYGAMASLFLDRLDAIDSGNSLVRNFHALTDLRRDVLALPASPERASLRLRMASIYRDIELFDEAYDEGEAASAEDPQGIGASLFLAQLYEMQGYGRRALSLYGALLRKSGDIPGLRQKVDSLRLVFDSP